GAGQYPAPLQRDIAQPLRARGVTQAAFEHVFDGGVTARQRVADDDEVGVAAALQMRGLVTLAQLDALLAQLRAHRRIDAGIRTRHLVAELACDQRQPAHEGAANTEDMDAHADSLPRNSEGKNGGNGTTGAPWPRRPRPGSVGDEFQPHAFLVETHDAHTHD